MVPLEWARAVVADSQWDLEALDLQDLEHLVSDHRVVVLGQVWGQE